MRTNDNLENHMVLNTADAPWNSQEQPRWECDCGASHAHDVKTLGYPSWHATGRFMEECAGADNECGRRCCHECAVTCRICGCHYCPEHRKGFLAELGLCAGCGEHYAAFGATRGDRDVEKLIEIERRRMTGYGYARTPLESEIAWLIQALKEAWANAKG